MKTNETILKLTKTDEPHVVDFIESILDREYPEVPHHHVVDDLDKLYETYQGKRDTFLIIKNNGAIVGTVGIKEENPQVALLRRLFVAPEYRNKGFGTKLVEEVIRFCEQMKYEMILFRGTNHMGRAIRIVEKLGFIKRDLVDFGDFHIFIYAKLL
ncbi:GNAT family N-acetyltransferase [bacterium]|nr:GNAT family N-acetyltransferase [bacterium]MCP5461810.1 GNAT family N-acetyltransferase [bacterium]